MPTVAIARAISVAICSPRFSPDAAIATQRVDAERSATMIALHVVGCSNSRTTSGLKLVRDDCGHSMFSKRSPDCQSRSPTKSNRVPWNMLECSPIVNSRIRLRMSSSTSVISDRLISGSTSCSRVLNVVPLEDERTAPSDYATGAAGRTGVEGSSRDRRSVDDVLDHRIGGQAVTGGVRSQPQAMAEHVLREVLNVFRI